VLVIDSSLQEERMAIINRQHATLTALAKGRRRLAWSFVGAEERRTIAEPAPVVQPISVGAACHFHRGRRRLVPLGKRTCRAFAQPVWLGYNDS
jgi:hypothetical protein